MARKPKPSLVESSTPGTIEQAAQVFLTDCNFRKLSPRTVEMNALVVRKLSYYVGDLPLAHVDAQILRSYVIEVRARCSAVITSSVKQRGAS